MEPKVIFDLHRPRDPADYQIRTFQPGQGDRAEGAEVVPEPPRAVSAIGLPQTQQPQKK